MINDDISPENLEAGKKLLRDACEIPTTTVTTSTETRVVDGKRVIVRKTVRRTLKRVSQSQLEKMLAEQQNEPTIVVERNGDGGEPTKRVIKRSVRRVDPADALRRASEIAQNKNIPNRSDDPLLSKVLQSASKTNQQQNREKNQQRKTGQLNFNLKNKTESVTRPNGIRPAASHTANVKLSLIHTNLMNKGAEKMAKDDTSVSLAGKKNPKTPQSVMAEREALRKKQEAEKKKEDSQKKAEEERKKIEEQNKKKLEEKRQKEVERKRKEEKERKRKEEEERKRKEEEEERRLKEEEERKRKEEEERKRKEEEERRLKEEEERRLKEEEERRLKEEEERKRKEEEERKRKEEEERRLKEEEERKRKEEEERKRKEEEERRLKEEEERKRKEEEERKRKEELEAQKYEKDKLEEEAKQKEIERKRTIPMIPKPNTTNDDDDLSPIPRKDTNHPAPLQRYVRDRTQSFHPVGGSAADLAPEINPEGAQTRVTSVNITDDSHVEVYTQIKSPQSVKAMAKQLDFVLYGQATPNSNKLKSTSNETTTISKSIYNNTNNSNNNPNNQGISDIQKKAQNLEFVLFGRKPTSLNNPTNNSNISDNDGVPAEVKKVLASVKHRAARLDFLMFGVKPANGIDVGMLLDTNREAETEVDSVPVPLSIRFMKRTPRKVARRPPSIISGNDL